MTKRSNKKGFTIIELVIVIAVIAILAAVLIPTFSGIIKKANQSADIQAVSQMNIAITAEFAVDKPEQDDMNAVIDALSKNGFNSKKALVPVSTGFKFAWSWADTCVVLINENNEIVFPEGITTSATDCAELSVKYLDATVADAAGLAEAIENGQMNITLDANVVITEKVVVPAGASVTLNLAGKDFDASAVSGRPFDMSDGATLVINAEGSDIKSGKYGLVNISNDVSASVTINGGNVTGSLDNGSFIKIVGGEADKVSITLNNVNMTDNAEIDITSGKTASLNRIMNANSFKGKLTLKVVGGKYEALAGFTGGNTGANFQFDGVTLTTKGPAVTVVYEGTFKNCTFKIGNTTVDTAPATAVALIGGTATVENCTITTESVAFYVYSTGTITANGNNITGTKCAGTENGTITIDGVKQ